MRVEGSDSKELRGAKVSISRLAKRRGVPITYQALTNGFAVLPDEPASKSKAKEALARQRRARHQDEGEARSA
jgi:hypothetical protein